jgi:hypothetical protein
VIEFWRRLSKWATIWDLVFQTPRVPNLEKAGRDLNDALNTERKDRQAAEAQIQQELQGLA